MTQDDGRFGYADRATRQSPSPSVSALRASIASALGFRLGHFEAERIIFALGELGFAIAPTDEPFTPLVMWREVEPWMVDVVAQVEFKPGVYHVMHRVPEEYRRDPAFLAEHLPRMLAAKLARAQEPHIAAQIAQGIEAATADETRSGSAVGESPVPEGDAPNPDPEAA